MRPRTNCAANVREQSTINRFIAGNGSVHHLRPRLFELILTRLSSHSRVVPTRQMLQEEAGQFSNLKLDRRENCSKARLDIRKVRRENAFED